MSSAFADLSCNPSAVADGLHVVSDLLLGVAPDRVERDPHRCAEKRHDEHRYRGGDDAFTSLVSVVRSTALTQSVERNAPSELVLFDHRLSPLLKRVAEIKWPR